MTIFRISDEKVNLAYKHQRQLLETLKTAKLQKERAPFSQIFKFSCRGEAKPLLFIGN